MNTTLNEIRVHIPCKPGWDKLLKSLDKTKADNEPLSFKYILESNGIEDAIWCLKVLPYIDTCLFSADIAESVLHIFENKYPDDNRPRLAIKAVRDFHSGKINETELESFSKDADAAYTAAIAAYDHASTSYVNTASANASYTASINAQRQLDEVVEESFIKHFV